MKLFILFGVILLAMVGGYFIFNAVMTEDGPTEEPSQEQNTLAVRGTVTEVNREQIAFDGPTLLTLEGDDGRTYTIAVPSMGSMLCEAAASIADTGTIAAGDVVEVQGSIDEEGDIVPCEDASDYLRVNSVARDEVYGFEFIYRKGPDGYHTFEDSESQHAEFVTGIVLFNQKEYEIFEEATDAREGPPAMHVRVYENTENLHAPVWAMRNPQESNIELALGEPEEAVVGGANAEHFVADGLYPIDTYVVTHGQYIYVLMGAYLDTADMIYRDFQSLVNSFTFIERPGEGEGAKIDPRVACESALLYMTFPSGEEADVFIAECIAGEHPEVIERYINDMGLDGATI